MGKKIIQELNLETTRDTLSSWMAHYVAELIQKIEDCNNPEEKLVLQKECTKTILKIWKGRKHHRNGINPLNDLIPVIKVLRGLQKTDNLPDIWHHFSNFSTKEDWESFAKKIEFSSNRIAQLSILSAINSKILDKKQEWLKDYRTLLSNDEIELFDRLTLLLNDDIKPFRFSTEEEKIITLEDISISDRYTLIFEKIKEEIDRMSTSLENLRKQFSSK